MNFKASIALGASVIALFAPSTASAQAERATEVQAESNFELPAQDLATALGLFSRQAGLTLAADPEALRGRRSAAVSGALSANAALQALLRGSGAEGRIVGGSIIVTVSTQQDAEGSETTASSPATDAMAEEIVVVGYSPRYDRRRTAFGNKTDDSIFEIPQSVVVLTDELIQEQAPLGLESLVRNVSGVQSLGQFGGRQDHILFRGFEFGVNRNGLLRNGVQSVSRVQQDLGNISQVEVLKGPSTLLYGRAEVGGLINLVTRQPGSDPGLDGFIRAASYEDFAIGGRVDGQVSDSIAASLFVSGATRESFKDSIFAERVLINPAVSFSLTDRLSLVVEAEHLNDARRMDRGHIAFFPQGTTNTPEGGASIVRLPREQFLGDPNFDGNNYLTNTLWTTLRYEGDSFDITSVLSYSDANEYRRNTEPSAFTSPAALAAGVITRSIVDGLTEQELAISDTYATFRYAFAGMPMETLIGGGYRYEFEGEARVDRRQQSLNVFTLALSPLAAGQTRYEITRVRPVSQSHANIVSAYISQRIDVTDRLSVFAGLRYEDINQNIRESAGFNQNGTQREAPTRTDYDFDGFAPRLGLVFRPTPQTSLYANYTESFSQQNDAFLAGTAVDLERGRQYELGGKAELFDGRFVATAAIFQIEKFDITLPGPLPDTFFPVGEARSRGFEFDITGEITPNWTVLAQYAYTDAETIQGGTSPATGAGTGAGATVTGRPLPGVPEHSASLWTNYTLREGILAGLEIGGGVTYVGERAGTATAQFFVPSFTRFDASVGYSIGETDFRFVINNLTDEEYYAGARGNTNIEYGAPRNVAFTIRHRFN